MPSFHAAHYSQAEQARTAFEDERRTCGSTPHLRLVAQTINAKFSGPVMASVRRHAQPFRGQQSAKSLFLAHRNHPCQLFSFKA
eukprot:1142236-Pelagomonas_calceolata.AAC.4